MDPPSLGTQRLARSVARTVPRLCAGVAGLLLALSPGLASAQGAAAPVTSGALTLDQVVQMTLTRNELASISDLNVSVVEAAQEKALTAFLPVLTATGVNQAAAWAAPKMPNDLGTGTITVSQPLLSASAFPLYAQARRLLEAQRAQNIDDRRLLGFAAATAFFAVLSAQDIVDAATHQLETAKANVEIAKARTETQLSSSNDLTKAQVDLANAAHEVETDKGTLANAFVQLAFTINAPVPSTLTPPAPTLTAAEKPLDSADALVRFAVDHRPDVVVAKRQLAAAQDYASEPMLRLVPTLGLQGQASGVTTPGSTGHYDQETVSVTMTWAIFDGGVRYSDKHSRDAQARIAELNLLRLARNVEAQVRGSAALLIAAQAAFQAAADGVKFARRNVDESAILYRQGLATALELIVANDSRFTAEVTYASAEFAVALAYLTLRQSLGLQALGTELQ